MTDWTRDGDRPSHEFRHLTEVVAEIIREEGGPGRSGFDAAERVVRQLAERFRFELPGVIDTYRGVPVKADWVRDDQNGGGVRCPVCRAKAREESLLA